MKNIFLRMKILIINSVCGIRSTGRIVADLAEQYISAGHECRIAYGRENVPEKYKNISYQIGTELNVKVNALKVRIFDNEAFNAKKETLKFIEWANNYNPDVVWLHNVHGYYINIELLFKWIKSRPDMEVKWTLHDCWPFTGHCYHFSYIKCEKWKYGCHHCPQKRSYPSSILLDSSKANFIRKKECFCGVKNMTLITPSQWLANLVRKSFLGEYPVEIAHNTIDTSSFKPLESNFRENNDLSERIIILGVASAWGERKGLYEFIELSQRIDTKYKIVLVGLTEKQIKKMPTNILCVPRTDSKIELAEIYTCADVFLNLSKEETFGLTIIEALSCGAYPIVYKGTACEEVVDCYGGLAVEQNINDVIDAIYRVTNHPDVEK
ncbi:MAG: glycosyltransferase [Clostridia bacterium]|nr:glycosyltransferase [Clostridia bacterium]